MLIGSVSKRSPHLSRVSATSKNVFPKQVMTLGDQAPSPPKYIPMRIMLAVISGPSDRRHSSLGTAIVSRLDDSVHCVKQSVEWRGHCHKSHKCHFVTTNFRHQEALLLTAFKVFFLNLSHRIKFAIESSLYSTPKGIYLHTFTP